MYTVYKHLNNEEEVDVVNVYKYAIGNIFKNKNGIEFKILEYIDYSKRKIMFLDSKYEKIVTVGNIKKGEIRDLNADKYHLGKKFINKKDEEFEIIEVFEGNCRTIKFTKSGNVKETYKQAIIKGFVYDDIKSGDYYEGNLVKEIKINGIDYTNKGVKNILYTENDNECWECFSHSKKGGNNNSYVSIRAYGKQTYLHRESYRTYNGEIPSGMVIMHTCDNPKCCNPKHLKIGTHKDNVDDKVSKNRHTFGETNGMCKLKKEEVLQILEYKKMGNTEQKISELIKTSKSNVHNILSGKTWSHITNL